MTTRRCDGGGRSAAVPLALGADATADAQVAAHGSRMVGVMDGLLRLRAVPAATGVIGLSLGAALTVLLFLLTTGALVVALCAHPANRWSPIVFGAVHGAVAVNTMERLAFGAPGDYVDLGLGAHRLPLFSPADAIFALGIAVLLLDAFGGRRRRC